MLEWIFILQEMLWTPFASFKGVEFMKIAVSGIFILLVSSYVIVDQIFLATDWTTNLLELL